MPTIREIVTGYEAVNTWEQEEKRSRLPRLTVESSVRQYLMMWNLARQLSPEAELALMEQRLSHYRTLRRRMERAAKVMGHVGQN